MNIREIEALTESEVKAMQHEHISIKDHDIYLVDCGEFFKYSMLVFKNGSHIYYANDYQLHHGHMEHEELKTWYIETASHKLFTDSELLSDKVSSYDDYKAKEYYIRNYYAMQFDRLSAFVISGSPEEIEFENKKADYPYYNSVAFCYMKDSEVIDTMQKMLENIEAQFKAMQSNDDVFREMIRKELYNHEYMYSHETCDALASLGLSYKRLTDTQKTILRQECNKIDMMEW